MLVRLRFNCFKQAISLIDLSSGHIHNSKGFFPRGSHPKSKATARAISLKSGEQNLANSALARTPFMRGAEKPKGVAD